MSTARYIGASDLVQTGPGIFYSPYPLPVLGDEIIELLKKTARSIPRRRARFCAHPSRDADQHDMVIASHRETYVAPHRHLEQSESFLIIQGTASLLLFDERGQLNEIVKMGPTGSELPFFYRMPSRQFHSLSIESELLVFVESSKGPFRPGNTENAPWAPPDHDIENGRAFISGAISRAVADPAR
jgi:cupin fold WbuC family metalloprotein